MPRKKLIRTIVPKISDALQAMVDGLRKQSKRSDFKISMGTYGSSVLTNEDEDEGPNNPYICYGCAATCAVQEIAQKDLTCEDLLSEDRNDQAIALGFYKQDIYEFESAINQARMGYLIEMAVYYKIPYHYLPPTDNRWSMRDSTWEIELPKVEAYIALLRKKNL